jgi:hypothetical protein
MKKILILTSLALAFVLNAQNTDVTDEIPTIKITSVTNVVTTVQPLQLTDEQLAGIIASVQATGVTASVQITTNNLQRIVVNKNPYGGYTVSFLMK